MAIDLIDAATLTQNHIFNKKSNNKHLPGTTALYSEARYFIIRKLFYRFLLLALALASVQLIIRSSIINVERFSSNLQNEEIELTSSPYSVAVAMKKTGPAAEKEPNLAASRKLLSYVDPLEAKKAALQNLEDVLLEPPRAASGKSRKYLKRTRYLPDLMGDSLQSYPRRVFIDVGLPEKEGGSGTKWFEKHYPTRNMKFEIFKIETVTEVPSAKEVAQIGMSDWLRKNVKEEEYVVMKAEAEVVEEMMRSNSVGLVDELFLECKPHGPKKGNRNRRAYWECLALYGNLRDKGVAVHQWWG